MGINPFARPLRTISLRRSIRPRPRSQSLYLSPIKRNGDSSGSKKERAFSNRRGSKAIRSISFCVKTSAEEGLDGRFRIEGGQKRFFFFVGTTLGSNLWGG